MNTKRSKRWNGDLDTLAPEFLKNVIEKMQSYGDRVQFAMPPKGPLPNYQVINPAGRKMGFDDRHLLLRLSEDGNVTGELSNVFTLAAITSAMNGTGRVRATRTRSASTSSSPSVRRSASAAAPAPVDTVEKEKYAYYKENRDLLPEGITKFSQDISKLMREGLTAEKAFEKIIEQHF